MSWDPRTPGPPDRTSSPVPDQFPAPDQLGRPGIPGIRRMTSFPSTCYRRRPWFYGWWWMMMDEPKILWGVDFWGLGGIMPLGLLGGCCHQTSWGDHWWLWCLVDDRQIDNIYIYTYRVINGCSIQGRTFYIPVLKPVKWHRAAAEQVQSSWGRVTKSLEAQGSRKAELEDAGGAFIFFVGAEMGKTRRY